MSRWSCVVLLLCCINLTGCLDAIEPSSKQFTAVHTKPIAFEKPVAATPPALVWKRIARTGELDGTKFVVSDRMRVPSGWIYRSIASTGYGEYISVSQVFVPDK